jgi:hypothetical protein
MSWQGDIVIEALERRLIRGRSIFGYKRIPPRVRDRHCGDFDHLATDLNTPASHGRKAFVNKSGDYGGVRAADTSNCCVNPLLRAVASIASARRSGDIPITGVRSPAACPAPRSSSVSL